MFTVRQFAARHAEFARRGVEVVRVFHSPRAALANFGSGPHAVPFPVLADPRREVYRRYGVTRSLVSLFGLLTPAGRRRSREAKQSGLAPRWLDALRDGAGGSPADFLVGPDGRIVRARYGRHFADSLDPDTALQWIDALEKTAQPRA